MSNYIIFIFYIDNGSTKIHKRWHAVGGQVILYDSSTTFGSFKLIKFLYVQELIDFLVKKNWHNFCFQFKIDFLRSEKKHASSESVNFNATFLNSICIKKVVITKYIAWSLHFNYFHASLFHQKSLCNERNDFFVWGVQEVENTLRECANICKLTSLRVILYMCTITEREQ